MPGGRTQCADTAGRSRTRPHGAEAGASANVSSRRACRTAHLRTRAAPVRARGAFRRRHERLDLRARQRAAQVRHRPAALEDLRAHPRGRCAAGTARLREAADHAAHRLAIEGAAGARRRPRGRRAARSWSRSVCSRPMNHVPAFDERLVVEVDRVLRREHHADAERARLLQQREHRRLRRRVRRPAAGSPQISSM